LHWTENKDAVALRVERRTSGQDSSSLVKVAGSTPTGALLAQQPCVHTFVPLSLSSKIGTGVKTWKVMACYERGVVYTVHNTEC